MLKSTRKLSSLLSANGGFLVLYCTVIWSSLQGLVLSQAFLCTEVICGVKTHCFSWDTLDTLLSISQF